MKLAASLLLITAMLWATGTIWAAQEARKLGWHFET